MAAPDFREIERPSSKMGRKKSHCYRNERMNVNRGAWSSREDEILSNYVTLNGEGKWRNVALNAGNYSETLTLNACIAVITSTFVARNQ